MVLQWPETDVEAEATADTSLATARVTDALLSSAELADFCSTHDLAGALMQLTELVQRHMTGVADISYRLQSDPDSDHVWVLADATLNASSEDVKKVLAEDDALTQEWISSTEAHTRDLITFIFSFA